MDRRLPAPAHLRPRAHRALTPSRPGSTPGPARVHHPPLPQPGQPTPSPADTTTGDAPTDPNSATDRTPPHAERNSTATDRNTHRAARDTPSPARNTPHAPPIPPTTDQNTPDTEPTTPHAEPPHPDTDDDTPVTAPPGTPPNTARSARRRRFARRCRSIHTESALQADALGFAARTLVQASLPYRAVPGGTYTRRAGRLTLHLQAPANPGLPYGRYPRLLLAWIATEAVRTRSPRLDLGPSLSGMMQRLGILPSGGTHGPIRRFRDQLRRLLTTSLVVTWSGDSHRTTKLFAADHFHIATRTRLRWDPDSTDPGGPGSLVVLDHDFFHHLLEAPVPLDLRALRALTSPLALDLYAWLTYRYNSIRRPTPIPWRSLYLQFGTQTARLRDFRRSVLTALEPVLHVYPDARLRADRHHLTLLPSPTHVPPAPGRP